MMIRVITQFTDELIPTIEDAEIMIAGFAGSLYRPLTKHEQIKARGGMSVERVFGNLSVEVRYG